MSEWKMDPVPVTTALTDTTTAYETLAGAVTEESIATIFSALTWGSWVTQCVPQALNEVLTEQQNVNLENIANHVAAGISGVGNSARALQEGNEDMAQTFQTEMYATAEDGDFSYFEQHGYKSE
ncbi:DUF6507 family protein [Microbacterium shaanxiense]